ncbi:hypothetical protein SGPA1_10135 [Streptomyces misionensis JCM 4497]
MGPGLHRARLGVPAAPAAHPGAQRRRQHAHARRVARLDPARDQPAVRPAPGGRLRGTPAQSGRPARGTPRPQRPGPRLPRRPARTPRGRAAGGAGTDARGEADRPRRRAGGVLRRGGGPDTRRAGARVGQQVRLKRTAARDRPPCTAARARSGLRRPEHPCSLPVHMRHGYLVAIRR